MKKLLAISMAFFMMCSLVACGGDATDAGGIPVTSTMVNTDTEWAIYWYLCGSDLESSFAAATNDLAEMMEVELPENVQVIIQTGGANLWQNDVVSAEKAQRYLYDSEGLTLIDEFDPVNMGDPQSLTDFLAFSKENYPGKRTMVSFWNHGGGSVTGAAFDEQFGMDSLTLAEMYEAFTSVFEENPDNQLIDIIGFDTCLMATVDTAFIFSDLGKYLVASEELEPGNGWLYSGWMGAIAENPKIQPLELSKAICDTYVEGCELVGTEDTITLSVTNLSKVNNLIDAYDDFGKEALANAVEDPSFFAHFSKIAASIENYGGNTREQGFTNMADLGHLAKKSAEYLPQTSRKVLSALDDCVEYKVNGKYRPESRGLACYYSYNGDIDDFNSYSQLGAGEAFKHFYAYGLTGKLSDMGMEYIAEMNYDSLPELLSLNRVGWEDMPLTVDAEGCATLTLGEEANNILSSLTFELYYADPDEDIMLCLGSDNDIIADWDKGVFKDNFRGVWGSLDGALCYMEIAYEGEGYNQYSVPILLNDEEYNLLVTYDFNTEEFYIEGARKPLDESGAADKNLRYLVEGDKIQTIHYATALSDDSDELMAVPIDTITVTPQTVFAETELGDGLFIMMFAMQDSQRNVVYSAAATFESVEGKIITTVD
ncbi:clostripain-related cysteine peptidase [Anaerotignum sp.]|uniref:clostripain-related cysteine peptidase n=1 Tax=Anaerotignum sp. TaxID=2039241 RepID=UPI0028AC37C0|nr:clostripain-related cysteine peptidase [Anaerotignum sp.]